MQVDQNFSTRRGDSCLVQFALMNSADEPYTLDDLTNANIVWRYSYYEHGPWLQEFPQTVIDAGGGTAGINVDVPTDTAGIFFHEIEMNMLGLISTLAIGRFDVSMDMAAPA